VLKTIETLMKMSRFFGFVLRVIGICVLVTISEKLKNNANRITLDNKSLAQVHAN
jgi:hypothetical protein